MKRKIFFFATMLCVISYFGITRVNFNSNRVSISLLNVEVLAETEEGDKINCPGGGTLCATVNAPTGTFKYYKKD